MSELKSNKTVLWLGKGLLIAIPVFLGFLALAIHNEKQYIIKKETATKTATEENIEYDHSLLKKFRALTTKMNAMQDYYCSGSINAVDHADTTAAMNNVPFEICKEGDRFYYLLGYTETIKKTKMSLSIDHQTKRMILSPNHNTSAAMTAGIMDLQKLSEAFESEHYHLKQTVSGSIQTLSLLNPRHITCKEYSVSVDTVTGMPVRFYTRLTNLDDPLRTDNEKIVDIKIQKWSNSSSIEKYTDTRNLIVKTENGWEATGKCKDYALISSIK